jgi:hypothetical protein
MEIIPGSGRNYIRTLLVGGDDTTAESMRVYLEEIGFKIISHWSNDAKRSADRKIPTGTEIIVLVKGEISSSLSSQTKAAAKRADLPLCQTAPNRIDCQRAILTVSLAMKSFPPNMREATENALKLLSEGKIKDVNPSFFPVKPPVMTVKQAAELERMKATLVKAETIENVVKAAKYIKSLYTTSMKWTDRQGHIIDFDRLPPIIDRLLDKAELTMDEANKIIRESCMCGNPECVAYRDGRGRSLSTVYNSGDPNDHLPPDESDEPTESDEHTEADENAVPPKTAAPTVINPNGFITISRNTPSREDLFNALQDIVSQLMENHSVETIQIDSNGINVTVRSG